MGYDLFFFSCLFWWFIGASTYALIFDWLGRWINIVPAKVHECKGDAFVNSAMFLSIEDEY